MANFFYVKNGGTLSATSDTPYSSAQTGSFASLGASNYYNSIQDALNTGKTTDPTAGDFIVVSRLHSLNYGTSTVTLTIPKDVTIIFVDDTAIDSYQASSQVNEEVSGSADFIFNTATGDRFSIIGGWFRGADDVSFNQGINEAAVTLKDCRIITTSNSTTRSLIASATGDGRYFRLINVDLQYPNTSSVNVAFRCNAGATVSWRGGSIIAGANAPLHAFRFAGNGGCQLYCEGVNFTALTSGGYLINSSGSGADMLRATFVNCLVNSTSSIVGTPISSSGAGGQRVEMYGCGNASKYYSMEIEDYFGTAIEDTTVVRTGAAQYDGTNELSIAVNPATSNCINGVAGLLIPLGGKYRDLSGSFPSQKVTVYLCIDNTTTAATALTQNDVQLYVKVFDNTTQSLLRVNRAFTLEPLKTGAALTTDGSGASNWEGENATNAKYYLLEYTIGVLSNVTNGRIDVDLEFMPASLHANDQIYVCPDFTVTDA